MDFNKFSFSVNSDLSYNIILKKKIIYKTYISEYERVKTLGLLTLQDIKNKHLEWLNIKCKNKKYLIKKLTHNGYHTVRFACIVCKYFLNIYITEDEFIEYKMSLDDTVLSLLTFIMKQYDIMCLLCN